jgi:hypothetical protein
VSGGSDLNEHVLTDKPNNTYYSNKQKPNNEDTYFSNQPLPCKDQSTNQNEIEIKTISIVKKILYYKNGKKKKKV